MIKNILTRAQLKNKLNSYNIIFTQNEFDELMKLGYFHVFNSFVPINDRNSSVRKQLADYMKVYNLDVKLRSILFPMIIGIENSFKQRLNDTIVQNLYNRSVLSSHYNDFVEHCVKANENAEAKRLLFRSTSHNNQIVNHYFSNHNDIPIWAFLELLDLGNFINLIYKCTDKNDNPINTQKIKEEFSIKCNFINSSGNIFNNNANAKYITESLRLIKLLRNNIAHNQPIIDGRYINSNKLKTSALQGTISDLSLNLNPSVSIPNLSFFNFIKITDAIAIIYIIYIYMVGRDLYSQKCIDFIKNEILNNTDVIIPYLHSKLFGSHYFDISNFLISL